jgi:hypothetical protein
MKTYSERRDDAKATQAEIQKIKRRLADLQDQLLADAQSQLTEITSTAMATEELIRQITELRQMKGAGL